MYPFLIPHSSFLVSRHLTSSNICHYGCFTHTDEVEQRTLGRTSELTRAALDAAGDVLCLHLVPHLLGGTSGKEIRFEPHRTSTDALATTDAGFFFCTTCLCTAHDEHARRAFANGHIGIDQCLTHHRTTTNHLHVTLWQTTTSLNQLAHRCAHASKEVAWLLELLARHSDNALKERLVLHHCFINSEGSAYVLNNGAYRNRQCRRCRNLTAHHSIDEYQ